MEFKDKRHVQRWGQVSLDDIDSVEFRSLKPAAVRVYLALLPFAKDGIAWPRRSTLATITGVAEENVSRAVAQLEGAGFLRREPFEGDSRRLRYVLLSPPSRRSAADDD